MQDTNWETHKDGWRKRQQGFELIVKPSEFYWLYTIYFQPLDISISGHTWNLDQAKLMAEYMVKHLNSISNDMSYKYIE